MNILKSITLTWWQAGLLKWSVFIIGIAFGATWPEFFAPYTVTLLFVGLALSVYLTVVWFRQ